ncbi:MAG: amidohydrolase [Pelotomaculum sp.]|uniref:Predicted metal-dependent hydrolase of the TIM-barrel fold n=1 Tax=Pelotomaculum thermopropionicum (strain DSM 13744 / JCM 10971 / SI) TaxID=370438 RepID=A5D6D6_PELTS|nr:amidohydrolase [Pelotomaculum sp.]BAF58195.1 predicted metal-dependent hydrolase of the TIM-barrel fold [Pelotomaculum thermopropionicum SI]
MSAPVIDFHIHPVAYESYCTSAAEWIKERQSVQDWPGFIKRYEDPAVFSAFLAENGVDYGVVLAELTPVTTGICTNEYVLEFCRGREKLIPFASINPYTTEGGAVGKEARRLLEKGFRGIKLYPTYQYFYPNDRMLYPLYAAAEEAGVPVMVHTGSSVFKGSRLKYGDPLFLDDVAVDFPGLRILIVHSGRGLWYNNAFFLARLHENVYMEIAGLPPQKLLDYFPELERNAGKIVFGSDWPGVASIKANIETIRNLPLSEETKEKILGGNAAGILGIK